jgi:hypothetical protein
MTVRIHDYIIRFEVSKNDISLMQVLNGKEYFSSIYSCTILTKPSLFSKNPGKVSSLTVIKD